MLRTKLAITLKLLLSFVGLLLTLRRDSIVIWHSVLEGGWRDFWYSRATTSLL